MPIITRRGTNQQMWEALQSRPLAPRARQPAISAGDVERGPSLARAADCHAWLPGSVQETLTRRRSVRTFRGEPVSSWCVRAVVAAARDAEAVVWPSASPDPAVFEILVAAFDVAGLAAGLYTTCGKSGADMVKVDSARLDSLRALYADAPVLLLICGDLNLACRVAGPAGYASMLVRAGTIGYGAWLRAISAGLAGSVYGGASHEVSAAARRVNADLWHLFTVALGYKPLEHRHHGVGEPEAT
jgi:hypothetical protein